MSATVTAVRHNWPVIDFGIGAASLITLALAALRLSLYSDPIGVIALALPLILWIMTGIIRFAIVTSDYGYPDELPLWWIWPRRVLSLLAPLSFFAVASWGNGVWVNANSEETTLDKPFILVSPFSPPEFVHEPFSVSQTLDFVARDGVRLACTIEVEGIVFDRNNTELERLLVDYAAASSATNILQQFLNASVFEAARDALTRKSSTEIAGSENQYLIETQVAAPIGAELGRMYLRWGTPAAIRNNCVSKLG